MSCLLFLLRLITVAFSLQVSGSVLLHLLLRSAPENVLLSSVSFASRTPSSLIHCLPFFAPASACLSGDVRREQQQKKEGSCIREEGVRGLKKDRRRT